MMQVAGGVSSLTVVLSFLLAGAAEPNNTGRVVAEPGDTSSVVAEAGDTGSTREQQYCNMLPDQPNPPGQPRVAQQYTARVEVNQPLQDSDGDHNLRLVEYAEYVYDAVSSLVSIHHYSKYYLLRYLLNWNTKQMVEVRISKTGTDDNRCMVRRLEDAVTLFPAVWGSGRNLSTDHMVEPGALMGLPEWAQVHYKGLVRPRGVAASRWDWCGAKQFELDAATDQVSMATFWTLSEWEVPVQEPGAVLPLGWQAEVRRTHDDGSVLLLQAQVHNVMYYRPEIVDYSAFLISEDIYCSGLASAPGHPFPDFSKDRLFTFSLEMRQTMARAVSWADGWYDFEKQLYRIDHDAMTKGRDSVPTTEIFDFNDGVAFSFPQESLSQCKVTIINNTRTDWADITGISHLWADNPAAFFGTDVANYTYYGPGVVRYVEGQEWRAERTDWPPDAAEGNTRTLWQWTFANKNVSVVTDLGEHLYQERQVPLGLRVTALHDMETSLGHIPKGSAYVYHMYDFNLESDAKFDMYSDGGDFDTYDCYSANWREHLKFRLDVSSWPGVVTTPIMTSGWFNEHWQEQLALYGRVSFLRITRVKTVYEEAGDVWVQFVLLYRHPMISQLDPNLYQHMTSGGQANTLISVAINDGNIKLEGTKPGGEGFLLVAESGSLSQVMDPVCSTAAPGTTKPPHHTTTTTLPHHTTTTKHPPQTTVTTTTNNNKPPSQHTTTTTQHTSVLSTSTSTVAPANPGGPYYTSGDLAGVGVGLLITGLAVGAGGTFLVVVKRIHLTILGWCGKA